MPTWLALVLVLLVVAPALRLVRAAVMTRGLGDAPVSVSLVVTVGLFVGLIGFAQRVWPPSARTRPAVLRPARLDVGAVFITYHQLLTIVLSGARRRRAVRAAEPHPGRHRDARERSTTPTCSSCTAAARTLVSALAWAIGTSLAALAGILLTPVIGLDYYDLTLLVINAYAAAMLGRLKSLPLTFAGAMGAGPAAVLRRRLPPEQRRPGRFRRWSPPLSSSP